MTRGPRLILTAAAACAAAFCAVLALAYADGPVRRADSEAFRGFAAIAGRPVDIADAIAHLFDPVPYVLFVALVIGYGLVRRGARHAAAAAVLLVGANLASQLLKPVLAHPRVVPWSDVQTLAPTAFPSGHSTAAMSLALAAVLVAPRAYRPLVAIAGGVVALAAGLALLVAGWHYPSDVVGGLLLATTWGLVTLAALRAAGRRWPERGSMRAAARGAAGAPPWKAAFVTLLAGAALAVLIVLSRADALVGYAQRHTSAVAAAAAVAAFAAALLAAVTALAARRS